MKSKCSSTKYKVDESIDSDTATDELSGDQMMDLNLPKLKKPISQELEGTKFQVMQKIELLEKINGELKKDYVPMAVMNNLSQSFKYVEVMKN